MEAKVDKELCISCGLCPTVCPEVFEIEDDGKAGVLVDQIPDGVEDQAREAQEGCPVDAIDIF